MPVFCRAATGFYVVQWQITRSQMDHTAAFNLSQATSLGGAGQAPDHQSREREMNKNGVVSNSYSRK